jgi:hypothetical protein
VIIVQRSHAQETNYQMMRAFIKKGIIMLSSLVDDDHLLAPTIVATPPLRSALSMPAFAAAIHRDDEEDEDDEEGAAKKATAPPPPTKPASALPDFEEALSNAETPAFLSVPAGDFEHVSFDMRPPAPEPSAQPNAAAASTREADRSSTCAPRSGVAAAAQSAAAAAAAMRERARGGKAAAGKGGAGKGGADKEKEKMDMKERTKLKRQRDQSASFLGGQWKSEEEMHLRDHFDS